MAVVAVVVLAVVVVLAGVVVAVEVAVVEFTQYKSGEFLSLFKRGTLDFILTLHLDAKAVT